MWQQPGEVSGEPDQLRSLRGRSRPVSSQQGLGQRPVRHRVGAGYGPPEQHRRPPCRSRPDHLTSQPRLAGTGRADQHQHPAPTVRGALNPRA